MSHFSLPLVFGERITGILHRMLLSAKQAQKPEQNPNKNRLMLCFFCSLILFTDSSGNIGL
jgi:hypothetical protein